MASDIAILKFMSGFKAMTIEQIHDFQKQYINGARVIKEAGFDEFSVDQNEAQHWLCIIARK